MIRRAAAVFCALVLNTALVQAEDLVFTITVPSADVHKGPSVATPVIGHAPQGAVLAVSRNLGSWARIPWPGSPDGVGYVHVTTGRLGAPNSKEPTAGTPARTSYASAPEMPAIGPRPVPVGERTVVGQQGGTAISHIIGVGGLFGPMRSLGATVRIWRHDRFGLQVGMTRDVMTSDVAAGRVTSMQVEPGVVYRLFDRVRDYVWVRPYIGSSVSFRRQTLSVPVLDRSEPPSDNGLGFRVFGGSELTFATVTQFGVSAEVGYRRLPAPFPGFEPDRMSISIAGHWYIK